MFVLIVLLSIIVPLELGVNFTITDEGLQIKTDARSLRPKSSESS